MTRKKRIDLEALLDEALGDLRHNATLHGKLRTESDFEADLFSSYFDDEAQEALVNLDLEFPWILSKFGRSYTFGRGGRTVMPSGLAYSHRESNAKLARNIEGLSALEFRRLLRDLRRYNASVKDWCKAAPDSCLEWVREEFKESIQRMAGKKRVTRTVTSYE